MRILLTGNMGYVGTCVLRHLRAVYPGATLIGVDTGYFGGCLLDPEVFPERDIDQQYFGDVRALPEGILAGVDAVVHLAALSNDPIGNRFTEATFEINHRASVEIARKAKKAGAGSFVFASSCSVYGLADEGPRTEGSVVNPLTPYARSKVAAERELCDLGSADFLVTCLRFATACGPSPRLRLDLVLNDFVASAVSAGEIRILSDGTAWRPLIDVRDMARAIEWAALYRNEADGGASLVVNVGRNDWNWRVRELAQAVATAIPGVSVRVDGNAQPDARSYRVDFSLFSTLAPLHQPELTLSDTIADVRNSLELAGFKDPCFRTSRYARLHVLARLVEKGLVDLRQPLAVAVA